MRRNVALWVVGAVVLAFVAVAIFGTVLGVLLGD